MHVGFFLGGGGGGGGPGGGIVSHDIVKKMKILLSLRCAYIHMYRIPFSRQFSLERS